MSLWTKIFGEPADWRLCRTLDYSYHNKLLPPHPMYNLRDDAANITDHTYTYYLYENQYGERKFDVIDTKDGDVNVKSLEKNNFVFCNKKFRTQIRPWLDGRYDPEIPDYETVPKNDFQNRLAKKKVKK